MQRTAGKYAEEDGSPSPPHARYGSFFVDLLVFSGEAGLVQDWELQVYVVEVLA